MGCICSKEPKDNNERSVSSLPNSTDSTVVDSQPARAALSSVQHSYAPEGMLLTVLTFSFTMNPANLQNIWVTGNNGMLSIYGSRGDSRVAPAGSRQRVFIDPSQGYASSEIDSLVLQTLKIIRTLVDK